MVESLFATTKRFIKKELSTELLYDEVANERKRDIFRVYELFDTLSEKKKHCAVRKIQRAFRDWRIPKVTVLVEPSLLRGGTSAFHNHKVHVVLHSNNFYYWYFLKSEMLIKIELTNDKLILHLDRFKARDCFESHMEVNLKRKDVIWRRNYPGRPTYSEETMDSEEMRVVSITYLYGDRQ